MTAPLILWLPGVEALAGAVARGLDADLAGVETRRFPDGESYVRLPVAVTGRRVVIVSSLARPDERFLPLVFAAKTARDLGAVEVVLVAPYLPYMRQDARFRPGEAITSRHFAGLLSHAFDRLITIDPHLHRHRALAEIYAIPAEALRAAPLLGDWIAANVERPLVIGPDAESEQWAREVARRAGAPHLVASKQRLGDREVKVSLPPLDAWRDRRAVLIDDIAASGRTLIEAARGVAAQGLERPDCVVVHALFAEDAFDRLGEAARRVVSTDTVAHASNAISVAPLLIEALRRPA
ncbi:MAG: ribose-phosphate pyrophosphokinase [Pseudomonadota bacterium]